MPQLILHPWFLILVLSWTIFLIIIPSKIMNYYFNNSPETTYSDSLEICPWDWLWH